MTRTHYNDCLKLANAIKDCGIKVEINKIQHYAKYGYRYTYTLNGQNLNSTSQLWKELVKMCK